MSDHATPAYPDLLGYLTGGDRFDAGCLHLALAVRPQVVRAGQLFEVVLLAQNVCAAPVLLTGRLLLPEADAAGKPERFIAEGAPLDVTLSPAEVGFAVLPARTLADTAPGDLYKAAFAAEITPMGDPAPLRPISPDAPHHLYLRPEANLRLMELKPAAFSTTRRGLFGHVIEAPFLLLPASLPRLDTDWFSLWSVNGQTDARPLLERHAPALRDQVLPRLQDRKIARALSAEAARQIIAAGYAPHLSEQFFIGRLLLSVLEMAVADDPPLYPGQEVYAVGALLRSGWPTDGRPIPLPNWCRALLERLETEPIADLSAMLAGPLFGDLLRDAIAHGFHLLYHVTRLELGSDDDKRAYGDQLVEMLARPSVTLGFVDIYLPLVLGGIIAAGRSPDADSRAHVRQIMDVIQDAEAERRAAGELVSTLIEQVLAWTQTSD